MKRGEHWSRGDKIALGCLIVGIIAVVTALLFPEVRVWLHLEKPVTASPAVTTSKPANPVVLPSQPAANPPPTTPPQVSQRSGTKVKGNNNVAGNNVAGSGNVVGNNNQVTAAPTIQAVAPNGIANAAPNYGDQTVNNFSPPARRINEENRASVIAILKTKPGKIRIAYVMGDEPYQFATDVYGVLHEAGWDTTLMPVALDTPWKGIRVQYHVKEKLNLPDGAVVSVPDDSLAGVLIKALMTAGIGTNSVKATPDEPEGSVTLVIAPRPE